MDIGGATNDALRLSWEIKTVVGNVEEVFEYGADYFDGVDREVPVWPKMQQLAWLVEKTSSYLNFDTWFDASGIPSQTDKFDCYTIKLYT